jgi:hypothetical protein
MKLKLLVPSLSVSFSVMRYAEEPTLSSFLLGFVCCDGTRSARCYAIVEENGDGFVIRTRHGSEGIFQCYGLVFDQTPRSSQVNNDDDQV